MYIEDCKSYYKISESNKSPDFQIETIPEHNKYPEE